MKLKNNYRMIFLSRIRRLGSVNMRLAGMKMVGAILLVLLFSGLLPALAHHFRIAGSRIQVMVSNDVCSPDDCRSGEQVVTCTDLSALFVPGYFYQTSPPVDFCSMANGMPLRVHTSLDSALQHRLAVLLRRYAPLIGAGVVLEPATGAVLAMASYRNENLDPQVLAAGKNNYCLYAGFPAASLFKIVTAGAVLEKKAYTSYKTLPVSGRFHTLYKHQLGLKRQRFKAQSVSLEKAFSLSVNPFFGNLGIHVLKEIELRDTARSMLFNVPLEFDLPVGVSRMLEPDTEYGRAEQACGFNTETTISPLHAAMIAALPVNKGIVMRPFLVERLESGGGVELYYRRLKSLSHPFREATVKNLQRLMRATVRYGTARKSFAHLKRVRGSRKWLMGGKTGSIDMPNRQGRCEWFAGYGVNGKREIAVAIVLVHGEKRTISSSYVAAEVIKKALKKPPLTVAKTESGH